MCVEGGEGAIKMRYLHFVCVGVVISRMWRLFRFFQLSFIGVKLKERVLLRIHVYPSPPRPKNISKIKDFFNKNKRIKFDTNYP